MSKSGNPNIKEAGKATQFSSTNQPKNRGRKGKSISEYLREFGEAKTVEYEIKVTKVGETKTKKGKIESESTLNEVIATTLLSKAMTGDLRAINIVLDRNEGKPKQTVDLGVTSHEHLDKDSLLKELTEILSNGENTQ